MTAPRRRNLLELLGDRHSGRFTWSPANYRPVKHWHDAIGHPILADAILDNRHRSTTSTASP